MIIQFQNPVLSLTGAVDHPYSREKQFLELLEQVCFETTDLREGYSTVDDMRRGCVTKQFVGMENISKTLSILVATPDLPPHRSGRVSVFG